MWKECVFLQPRVCLQDLVPQMTSGLAGTAKVHLLILQEPQESPAIVDRAYASLLPSSRKLVTSLQSLSIVLPAGKWLVVYSFPKSHGLEPGPWHQTDLSLRFWHCLLIAK